ncbi:hypothetical protein DVH24_031339 [Malus domestica]|uniref:Uncharacterized protein n=1 Tax=Malus domestica TaxID=3750 RepID=A0A498HC16_MALDO|nr:hypothetical protein DVH24_031339 [Malus domestica]
MDAVRNSGIGIFLRSIDTFRLKINKSSLGTLNAKITNLNFGRARVGVLQSYGVRTWTGRKPQLYSCLSISRQSSEKVLHEHSIPSLQILSAKSLEEVSEESGDSGPTNQLVQNFDEVSSLIICNTYSMSHISH